MGRSQAHPTLSRRDNKKRKENERFFRVKKYRKEVLGKKKQTEHNLQQTVVGHNRSILKARVLALIEKRRAARLSKIPSAAGTATVATTTADEPPLESANADDASESDAPADAEEEPRPDEADVQAEPKERHVREGEKWKVVSPGAVVRTGEGLLSDVVGRLEHGAFIDLVENRGRRGRIVHPLRGWVSLLADDKSTICQRSYEPSDDGDHFDELSFDGETGGPTTPEYDENDEVPDSDDGDDSDGDGDSSDDDDDDDRPKKSGKGSKKGGKGANGKGGKGSKGGKGGEKGGKKAGGAGKPASGDRDRSAQKKRKKEEKYGNSNKRRR
ncbi:hypothetical protein DIPPA_08051 [Diplonema papillatum]|nr:hypothetical protein DIPPA_08051 [Diplonema papillatum]